MRDEKKVLQLKDYLVAEEEIVIFSDEVSGHHPAHSHNFIELVYVDRGAGTHTVNGKRESIQKKDLYLFRAFDITHAFDACGAEPLVVYNCIFNQNYLEKILGNRNGFLHSVKEYFMDSCYGESVGEYIKIHDLKPDVVAQTIYEMSLEYQSREAGYTQIIEANLTKLLILIFRAYQEGKVESCRLSVHKQATVKNAVELLRQHHCENITCEWLADKVHLSVNYFRSIFKEVTGITMIEMLQGMRIDSACRLLEETEASVSEISHSVGYRDLKYFYQLFQKIKKMTPGKYRVLKTR